MFKISRGLVGFMLLLNLSACGKDSGCFWEAFFLGACTWDDDDWEAPDYVPSTLSPVADPESEVWDKWEVKLSDDGQTLTYEIQLPESFHLADALTSRWFISRTWDAD